MEWQSGDTDERGRIQIEVEVTWPGARTQTFRADGGVDIKTDSTSPTSRRQPMLELILLVVAVVCFALAAVNVSSPRVNLVAAGLLALSLAWLLPIVIA